MDDIILAMHKNGMTNCIRDGFGDRRADNTVVPFDLTMMLAIAAKMRVHSSLTDIPYALTDHRTICELGYSMVDTDRDIKSGLMSEGTVRHLVGKYSSDEFLAGYNRTVQTHIMPRMDIRPNIHILDCTKLEVNLKNTRYENSAIARDSEGNIARGYKLATIRGIVKDTGIIEDIRFSPMNVHDLELSRQMLLDSSVLKSGDILINDKGFLSRDLVNQLKTSKNVNTYVPLKKNMDAYHLAVSVAIGDNEWQPHPKKKRKDQKIALVKDVGPYWTSDDRENDVPVNACVVWDTAKSDYFVFVTTDISKSAVQIIKTYELRPEIEEDYRQLKDFWKLEDFKSTKLNIITFHIVCVLLGYLFFQLYTMLPEGEPLAGRSFPVVLKNYCPVSSHHLAIYSGDIFGVMTVFDIVQLYSNCSPDVQEKIADILKMI